MPLVRIDVPAGRDAAWYGKVSNAVQEALHEALDVPTAEKFHIMTEHEAAGLAIDQSYLGIHRSKEAVIIQATLNYGRDAQEKEAFFSTLTMKLSTDAGIAPADVVINLIEVDREDWSFGDGKAQLSDQTSTDPKNPRS